MTEIIKNPFLSYSDLDVLQIRFGKHGFGVRKHNFRFISSVSYQRLQVYFYWTNLRLPSLYIKYLLCPIPRGEQSKGAFPAWVIVN